MELLKNMPISKLVFYETYPEMTYHNLESVSEVLRSRLIKNYRLDKEKAIRFIEQEKTIILKRGDNLEDYLFDKKFEQCIEIFYKRLCISKEKTPPDKIYNNVVFSYVKGLDFTWSEYLKMHQLFTTILTKLALQMSKVQAESKINTRKQLDIIKSQLNDSIELEKLLNIKEQLLKEYNLIEEKQDFYDSLNRCIFIEIANNPILVENLQNKNLYTSVLMSYIIFIEGIRLKASSNYKEEVEQDFYNRVKQFSKK